MFGLGIAFLLFVARFYHNPGTVFLFACDRRAKDAPSTLPTHLPVSEANKTGEKALTGARPRRRFEPVPSLFPQTLYMWNLVGLGYWGPIGYRLTTLPPRRGHKFSDL